MDLRAREVRALAGVVVQGRASEKRGGIDGMDDPVLMGEIEGIDD